MANGPSFRRIGQRSGVWLVLLLGWLTAFPFASHAAESKTKNVFLIISDGLRWQEVFSGAEEALLDKTNGGVRNVKATRAEFWRKTPEARRETLMPFFWGEIAKRGQLYGNQARHSMARVTNTRKFSYPGYNEILTGQADERVDSNDKKPNPNINVFEWLQGRPGFKDSVAVFASWDVFPYIFNCERSHLPIWPAWETRFESKRISPPAAVTELLRDTTSPWDDVIFDSFLFHAALDYVDKEKPRVFFLGFGETDEWAHSGRYDCYLQAAHHVDHFVKTLWNTVQSIPQYHDTTTIIVAADHGRGHGLKEWKDHGKDIAGAEGIWLAVLGPDTPALGERANAAPITQSQIATTVAALLGEDFRAAFPRAGAPISELIGASSR